MKTAASVYPGRDERRIFNHDILSCTHEGVAGNHLYSGRALGLTEPDDLIQIHPFLKREWGYITAHYARIGLPHSKNVIWDVSLGEMERRPEFKESVFFFGPAENRVRSHHHWQRVVEHINDKNNFTALASHLRLDVPRTLCFQGKEWFAGIEHFPFPCYIKAAVSVAGKGIYRCENQQQVIQALAHYAEGVPLQVQVEINADVFLNVQYRATEEGIERLLVSEQLLDGCTHQGNRYPARHEPWEAVEPMAEWLWEKGIRDIFAFDVGVVQNGHRARFVPIECNPRFNGASYPSGIAGRLRLPQWTSKDLKTRYGTLSDIDLTGIEFDPATGAGIILVNWGTILAGKLGVLLAGTPAKQRHLEAELRARL